MRRLVAFASCALALARGAAAQPASPEAMVREVSRAVEEIRGLAFERPVTVRRVTSAEARAHFAERARQLWPEAQVRVEQAAYAQLGLLPPGMDLLSSFLDVLEEQAMGYYDPGSDTFFVVDGASPGQLASVLVAHELTHALDDQHFGIDAMLARAGDDDDRSTAASAVIEGSGTAVMTAFLARELRAGRIQPGAMQEMQRTEAGRAARLRAAPPVLQRSLLASYVLGLSFLMRGDPRRIADGIHAADLNHAFEDPPVATVQVLHPEKYWDAPARTPPRAPALPDLSATLGAGWTLAGKGTLGELVLAVITGAGPIDPTSPDAMLPARWTNAAASGTAGDVFHYYTAGGRSVTLLATLWESERDASEFQDGLRAVPRRRAYCYANAVVLLAGDDLGERAETVAAAALQAITAAPAGAAAP